MYYIANSITVMIKNNIELSKLLKDEDLLKQAIGTGRTIQSLLEHTMTIPIYEILLLKGLSKQEIYKNIFVNIKSIQEFEKQSIIQLERFKKELKHIQFLKKYSNREGTRMIGLEWCFELLSHYSHHKSQLYINILSIGQEVPQELTRQFFTGHLK